METAFNLIWLAIAVGALAYCRDRSRQVFVAVVCVVALLFPIISISDDLNPTTFNETAAAVVSMMILMVAFVTVGRLRAGPQRALSIAVVRPTDPRSPPAL